MYFLNFSHGLLSQNNFKLETDDLTHRTISVAQKIQKIHTSWISTRRSLSNWEAPESHDSDCDSSHNKVAEALVPIPLQQPLDYLNTHIKFSPTECLERF